MLGPGKRPVQNEISLHLVFFVVNVYPRRARPRSAISPITDRIQLFRVRRTSCQNDFVSFVSFVVNVVGGHGLRAASPVSVSCSRPENVLANELRELRFLRGERRPEGLAAERAFAGLMCRIQLLTRENVLSKRNFVTFVSFVVTVDPRRAGIFQKLLRELRVLRGGIF